MRRNSRGFTIVELMFAVVFISILLVAIAMLTIQIINIYTKGTTLNAANQAGQQISSELQHQLNQSKKLENSDMVVIKSDDKFVSARVCTGTFSYVFNAGSIIENTSSIIPANVATYSDNGSKDLRFVKVNDSGKEICRKSSGGAYPGVPRSKATDLLADGNTRSGLVIHKFSITGSGDIAGGQVIYDINMTVGTNGGQENITDSNSNCKPPSDGADDFCAVNNFEFTARAANQAVSGGSN